MVERVSLSVTTGTSGISQLVTFCTQIRKERKGKKALPAFSSFLFIYSGNPAHGMIPLMFKIGLFSLVNPAWKFSHRYSQVYVSMVTLNPDKLILKINYNRPHEHFVSMDIRKT